MDKRSIFRYRAGTITSTLGAGWATASAALELRRPSVQGPTAGSPDGGREAWETPTQGDSLEARLPEKPSAGSPARPYRRPPQGAGCESTKVDE